MVKDLDRVVKFDSKGIIKIGAKAIKANCPSCKKQIIAIKPGEKYLCSICESEATPIPGEREFPKSLDYFLVPDEIKERLGESKPTSINVIPAYQEFEKTLPNSYCVKTREGRIYCSGDGETARRYNAATKSMDNVPCSDTCEKRVKGDCKLSATFYFLIPKIDMLSAYKINLKSQSVINVASTLNKLKNPDGLISRAICELQISKKQKKNSSEVYYVVHLLPPAISMDEYKKFRQGTALEIKYAPDAQQDDIDKKEGEAPTPQADDPIRLENGRRSVKEKLHGFVKGPLVDSALEMYVNERYKKTFEELPVNDLLDLWKGIKEGSDIVDKIFTLTTQLRKEALKSA